LNYGDLISVVVPVYNRADRIGRSVGSLICQSYRNLEIILVDDCSRDDIASAVAALNDPRVRLVRRAKNGGAGAARNTGVAEARSDWVAFHDSDDICVFDRIERQVRALMALPEDHVGVYSASIFYNEVTEARFSEGDAFLKPHPYEKRRLSGAAFDDTVAMNFINVPTMLIRKAAFIAAGGFDERLRNNEDWDFTLRLTRQGKFGFVPDPLYLTVRQLPRPVAQGAAQISLSDPYSARSFVAVIFKLRRLGVSDAVLQGHYLSAARYLMRTGRYTSARKYLGKALKTKPVSVTGWRLYGLSHLPRLYAWLRRHDSRPV
jgi:glycosyltransferase involved in cell wall biosynthesis